MLPPFALVLFCFVLFLLRFPLGKLPLPFLALEKRLYLRGRAFPSNQRTKGQVLEGLALFISFIVF